MRLSQCIWLVGVLAFSPQMHGQDIHFTQYNMSPMTLNPANVGRFEGTIRVGGIYRNQWSSIINNPYSTPSAWVDAPIIRGLRPKDWIGVGLLLYQDRAGAAGLTHGAFKFGATYHLAFGKKGNTVLSVGGHYGGEQRRIDINRLQFSDGFNKQGEYVPALSMDNGRVLGSANYRDIDLGVVFFSKINKTMDLHLGFSVYHLTEPNYSLIGSGPGSGPTPGPQQGFARLPRRYVTHGQFNVEWGKRFTLSPSFLFQTMEKNDEIIVQTMAGYLFNPEKDVTLRAGVGYRLSDAIHVMVGARVKDLTIGAAYDINISDLTIVSNYRGGFEIAANYIIKIYKPTVIKTKVLCPRF
ncbi:MAG: PorP/SprF family type IX secretion system membrane protein [Saprospiraceae bacterium]|nr:PorP/SprF family type IX secretion system membrane protein [Saprospiraceae bacterium]MDW8483303.1 PorP/SprF family type IX secretion system membrane protein [Saprospiraceae bacterium]